MLVLRESGLRRIPLDALPDISDVEEVSDYPHPLGGSTS